MIEINGLTKIYRLNKKQRQELKTKEVEKIAVNQLTMKARKGEIYGLLGPNGAGKTTTLRCVATLISPTSGEIFVNGCSVETEGKLARKQIGFLTSDMKLDEQFSIDYLFDFFGRIHGVSPQKRKERKEKLFSAFGIEGFSMKPLKELSTGMKQKASIVVSLVHDPEIIIFDEPTNGLDVITARSVTNYLRELKKEGKLILISTHIMPEVQKLCDRIGIMLEGRLVCEGSLQEILEVAGGEDLEDAFFNLYEKEMKGAEHAGN